MRRISHRKHDRRDWISGVLSCLWSLSFPTDDISGKDHQPRERAKHWYINLHRPFLNSLINGFGYSVMETKWDFDFLLPFQIRNMDQVCLERRERETADSKSRNPNSHVGDDHTAGRQWRALIAYGYISERRPNKQQAYPIGCSSSFGKSKQGERGLEREET